MTNSYTIKPRRMTTSMERVFRPIDKSGIVYREIYIHYIHFVDSETGEVLSTKVDKNILGKWYKVAGSDRERSLNGEAVVNYVPPGSLDQVPVRLVALGEDVYGNPILR